MKINTVLNIKNAILGKFAKKITDYAGASPCYPYQRPICRLLVFFVKFLKFKERFEDTPAKSVTNLSSLPICLQGKINTQDIYMCFNENLQYEFTS